MKIGFLITARLKSSRLPYKILKDLNGKTVIERVIDRAKEVIDISEIILCTSINPQDKPLIDIAKNNNIYYFNGDEEDVLNRLLNASKLFNLDYFIGITADNPLFSIYYSNLIVNELKKNKYDYVNISGLPLGCATYGMRINALKTVCKIKTIKNTEIWGYLINRPDIFETKTINVVDELNHPEFRLTLDYSKDYYLINHLYKNINYRKTINLYDAIEYLSMNSNIVEINKECEQINLSEEEILEIDTFYKNYYEDIKKIKEDIYKGDIDNARYNPS